MVGSRRGSVTKVVPRARLAKHADAPGAKEIDGIPVLDHLTRGFDLRATVWTAGMRAAEKSGNGSETGGGATSPHLDDLTLVSRENRRDPPPLSHEIDAGRLCPPGSTAADFRASPGSPGARACLRSLALRFNVP